MTKLIVIYEKTKTGYSAYVPQLPGVIATGRTKIIVDENISKAIIFHLEGLDDIQLYDTVKAKKEKSVPFDLYLKRCRTKKT
jgi:predicted RNase H-like HicB family nuclease